MGLVAIFIGEAMGTQTSRRTGSANPLKLLAPKAGDFLCYSPASENSAHSESNLLPFGAGALPSFRRNTVQMLGFSEA